LITTVGIDTIIEVDTRDRPGLLYDPHPVAVLKSNVYIAIAVIAGPMANRWSIPSYVKDIVRPEYL